MGNFSLSRAILGYLWLSLDISGYLWLSLATSGHLWLSLTVFGYFYQVSSIDVQVKAGGTELLLFRTGEGPPEKSQGRIQARKQFQDCWAPALSIQLLLIKVVKKLVMITGHEVPRCRNNLHPWTNPRPPGNREIDKTKASTELWDPLYQLLYILENRVPPLFSKFWACFEFCFLKFWPGSCCKVCMLQICRYLLGSSPLQIVQESDNSHLLVGILKNKGDRRWGGDSRKAAGSCHLIMGIIWKLHFKQTLETSWGWAVIWRSGRRGFVFLVGLDTHVMGGGRESIGPRKLNSFKTSKVFAHHPLMGRFAGF